MNAFKATDRMIFKSCFVTNIVSGKKERKRMCVCTACSEEWYADWVNENKRYGIFVDYEYPEIYSDGEIMNCPYCGERVKLTHTAHIEPHSPYNPSTVIGVFGRIDDKFTITEYRVIKQFHKTGRVTYQTDKWNCYVFETDKKCVALKAWFRNSSGGISLRGEWYQLQICAVADYAEHYYNPVTRDLTDGTTMENSRFFEYMQTNCEKWPAAYLRYYQNRHRVETLLQIGLTDQVGREINDKESKSYGGVSFEWANWKEKSPYKIIGFDRAETAIIKQKEVMGKHLKLLKDAKGKGLPITARNVDTLLNCDSYSLDHIINGPFPQIGEDIIKTCKYLKKQQPYPHLLLCSPLASHDRLGFFAFECKNHSGTTLTAKI